MRVTIHHVLTGAAAEVGGVRFDFEGRAIILLAKDMTVDTQAEILGELLAPDDSIEYSVTVPAQRAANETLTELAG